MGKRSDGGPIWFYVLMLGILIFLAVKAFIEPWIIGG